MKTVFAVLLLCLTMFAQEAVKPTEMTKSIQASPAIQNKILKAEHDLDQIIATETQANVQYLQMEKLQQQLQTKFNEAEAKKPAATKAVDDAVEDAWKESKLSKDQYTFDPANFTFSIKPPDKNAKK
jgi:hypothetical protein